MMKTETLKQLLDTMPCVYEYPLRLYLVERFTLSRLEQFAGHEIAISSDRKTLGIVSPDCILFGDKIIAIRTARAITGDHWECLTPRRQLEILPYSNDDHRWVERRDNVTTWRSCVWGCCSRFIEFADVFVMECGRCGKFRQPAPHFDGDKIGRLTAVCVKCDRRDKATFIDCTIDDGGKHS